MAKVFEELLNFRVPSDAFDWKVALEWVVQPPTGSATSSVCSRFSIDGFAECKPSTATFPHTPEVPACTQSQLSEWVGLNVATPRIHYILVRLHTLCKFEGKNWKELIHNGVHDRRCGVSYQKWYSVGKIAALREVGETFSKDNKIF